MTHLSVAHLREAVAGEDRCGDWVGHGTVALKNGDEAHWLAVVDGLGHGPAAAEAADEAAVQLQAVWTDPRWLGRPADLIKHVAPALVPTRGAAVGLACVHQGQLWFSGVGNTRAWVWRSGHVQRLPSRYGVVGDLSTEGRWASDVAADSHIALQQGDWILMFSDGLDENLRVDVIPGAWSRAPLQLCRHLMQRARQARDDASVLAAHVESA